MTIRGELIALVHPEFSNGDPDPDDLEGVEQIVDKLLEHPMLLGRAYFHWLASAEFVDQTGRVR